MLPYLSVRPFEVFGLEFQPFFILVVTGIVVGVIVYDRICRRGGQIDRRTALHLPEVCLVGGLVGAHLVHVLVYHPSLMAEDPLVLLKVWGGFSSIGGFFGGAAAGLVYLLVVKKSAVLPYGDRALTGLVIGWIFGRTGCALTHDHPGVHTDFFLGVAYPDGVRHDLGTYELFLTLGITGVLLGMGRAPRRVGDFMAAILLIYSPVRFFLDFLRIREGQYADARYGGLTAAQIGMIVLLAAGVWLLATRRRRPLDVAFFGPKPSPTPPHDAAHDAPRDDRSVSTPQGDA